MHVVDRQQIQRAESLAKGVEFLMPDRLDVLVGELLAGDVADPGTPIETSSSGAETAEQVTLADAAVAVDEQDRSGAVEIARHAAGGVEGESVGIADLELLEAGFRVA